MYVPPTSALIGHLDKSTNDTTNQPFALSTSWNRPIRYQSLQLPRAISPKAHPRKWQPNCCDSGQSWLTPGYPLSQLHMYTHGATPTLWLGLGPLATSIFTLSCLNMVCDNIDLFTWAGRLSFGVHHLHPHGHILGPYCIFSYKIMHAA